MVPRDYTDAEREALRLKAESDRLAAQLAILIRLAEMGVF